MNNITKWTLLILSGVTFFSSAVSADVKKGQRIFNKQLKASCRMTGINSATLFAVKHTQDEWESIKQAGKFSDEILKICPQSFNKLKAKYQNDLYAFFYEYASDSGKVPNY